MYVDTCIYVDRYIYKHFHIYVYMCMYVHTHVHTDIKSQFLPL